MSYASWGNDLYSGKKSYNIVGSRKKLLLIGTSLIVISILLMGILGLERSIDFKGGTEITISQVKRGDTAPAKQVVRSHEATKHAQVTSLGTSSVRVHTDTLSTNDSRTLVKDLAKAYQVTDAQVAATTIGPSWGSDVTRKAVQSLVIFLVLVGLLLALYFRTWTMAASALFALAHDVLITGAVLAITRVEISPATIIGVLTILGYSLYDTVVVFDKVRELTVDFESQRRSTYGELVNLSVNQTMVRSINTSVIALLPVTSILVISWVLLGGGTLRDISLALFVGMIAGSWSSIFIASPTLVFLRSGSEKIKKHTQWVLQGRMGTKAGKDDDLTVLEAEASLAQVAHPVRPGQHRGQKAQPKRPPRSKR